MLCWKCVLSSPRCRQSGQTRRKTYGPGETRTHDHAFLYYWAYGPYWTSRLSCHMVELEVSSCLTHYCQLRVPNILYYILNPLTARIFTFFGHSLLEDRALHKEAWVAKLLGTHLSIQVQKKVKFSWRDNSSLAVKGLIFFTLFFSFFLLCCNTFCNKIESRHAKNS